MALGLALTLQGWEQRGPGGPGLPGPAKKVGPRAGGPELALTASLALKRKVNCVFALMRED